MQHLTKILALTFGLTCAFTSFASSPAAETPILGKTLTQAKQQNMTPKQALQRLKDGNQRFLNNTPIPRDYLKQAHQSSYGQYPFAVVLNCMDSRSVPELFFDQGLADLFTLRVAGNVLNDDILGSMEFATKVAGSRLIVVLAHTSCGAVSGACSGVQLGHLSDIIDKIKPVVQMSMQEQGTKNCSDAKLIDAIAKANALKIVKEIQERSPIIKDLINKKQVGIVAGLHDIKTGKVQFFEEKRSIPN
ncbi:carbonic anhydrase family protein [Fluoribacter gormanii]|uniref:Carbonic anhydrase n=1 Tax=Fluoribacter gormanii TaxID=464 RepID=A0A377GM85_9GAMM|nr:carbonic anhydrase family protein [Fluoribacter gormanii]KTD04976.1 carbonic anhydrase [Fluoribacter gormanii]MCW8471260.1 carbonic anhydrase family protein [Fluoribacter gormanii]SIR55033.1 carbonic anhydrase [Fluoribacter gormanii]STO25605.1 Carbonic anhydrase [Fluoribacter gormanii]